MFYVGVDQSTADYLDHQMQSTATFPVTPVSRFGKDHWSILAYVETQCVEARGNTGSMRLRDLRANEHTHPMVAVNFTAAPWKDAYSTRLHGYAFDRSADVVAQAAEGNLLLGHDDWDCLEDAESAGLLRIVSHVNGFVQLTDEGLAVAGALREHKARGGTFATFVLKPMPV